MRIGELAARAAVNVQTVRYYERRGLVPPAARKRSGYRDYAPEDLKRVRFIKHAQALGFTLQEIADLLALRVDAHTACAQVEAKAAIAINRIDRKVVQLTRMCSVLTKLTSACQDQCLAGACPILLVLDDESAPDA